MERSAILPTMRPVPFPNPYPDRSALTEAFPARFPQPTRRTDHRNGRIRLLISSALDGNANNCNCAQTPPHGNFIFSPQRRVAHLPAAAPGLHAMSLMENDAGFPATTCHNPRPWTRCGFCKKEWTRSNDDYWRRTVSSAMQTIAMEHGNVVLLVPHVVWMGHGPGTKYYAWLEHAGVSLCVPNRFLF